jgi:hypothetical protein
MTKERIKRLILFPLVVFYAAVLVVAAWPRQLMVGRAMEVAQLGANFVLAQFAWPAGLTVFSGQDTRTEATVRVCLRLVGVTPGGEGRVLFDTMAACRDRQRGVLKAPLELYLTDAVARALRHLRTPRAHGDRNSYPLNELYAIADWLCHKDGASVARVLVTARYQSKRLASGEDVDVTIDEGVHHCAEGAWEPIGLKHRSR